MATLALPRPDIARAYRRVDREAAIMGSDPRALTLLCFDEFASALGSALHADAAGAHGRRNDAVMRALSALAALRLGIDPSQSLAAAMTGLFDLAERSLRVSIVAFAPATISAILADFREIRVAMAG